MSDFKGNPSNWTRLRQRKSNLNGPVEGVNESTVTTTPGDNSLLFADDTYLGVDLWHSYLVADEYQLYYMVKDTGNRELIADSVTPWSYQTLFTHTNPAWGQIVVYSLDTVVNGANNTVGEIEVDLTGYMVPPSYRFVAETAITTSDTEIYLNMYDGADDLRALGVGNTLWFYGSATVVAESDWATVSDPDGDPRNWKYIGTITLVEEESSRIKVTLASTSLHNVADTYAIQCQPRTSHTSATKTEAGGSPTSTWTMTTEIHFRDDFLFSVGSSAGKYSSDGGATFTDDPISWATGDKYMRATVDIDGLTTEHTAADFPGVIAFKLLTSDGTIGAEFVYSFSEEKSVGKEVTIPDVDVDLLDLPFSDFSEMGVVLGTDWDNSVNPNIKYIIEYKLGVQSPWATGAGDGYVYGAASTPEPAFNSQFFKTNTAGSKVFTDPSIVDIGESVTFRLETFDQDDASVGSVSYIDLAKVYHMFDNYFGTINKYNSGGTDHRGAGFLIATTGWSYFSPDWDLTAVVSPAISQFAGGLYAYDANASIDPKDWRRYSFDPSTGYYYKNGPSFAAEVTGDHKVGYFCKDWQSSPLPGVADFVEAGSLFFTFPDGAGGDSQYDLRGEILLGLGKNGGATSYAPLTAVGSNYNYVGNMVTTGSVATDRGAALVILRSGVYGDQFFKPKVFINDLSVNGLLIGDGNTAGRPERIGNQGNRALWSFLGWKYRSKDNLNFLASFGSSLAGVENWHTYPYISNNGLHMPSVDVWNTASNNKHALKIYAKTENNTSLPTTYYTGLEIDVNQSHTIYESHDISFTTSSSDSGIDVYQVMVFLDEEYGSLVPWPYDETYAVVFDPPTIAGGSSDASLAYDIYPRIRTKYSDRVLIEFRTSINATAWDNTTQNMKVVIIGKGRRT